MNLFGHIDGLEIQYGPWSRLEIRKRLAHLYSLPELLDMDRFPHTTKPYLSISHTKTLSGWASYSKPLGLDIENLHRNPHPNTLLRVSTKDELARAPSPLHLWVAKEAAFKALWPFKPSILSSISVESWEPNLNFLARWNSHQASGHIEAKDDNLFSIAILDT